MDVASLITDLAGRRPVLIKAYALLCSVLGCAALRGAHSSGLRPLAQIGSWADAVGWSSGGTWFAGTATSAFAHGAGPWSVGAAALLLCVALTIGFASTAREAFETPASLTLWLSLATLAQAGQSLTPWFAAWLALTLAICVGRYWFDRNVLRDGGIFAFPFFAPPLGLATAPLGLLAALLTETGAPSEPSRARSITRAVLLAKEEAERDARRRRRGA
ncbi:hypothetical protein [Krasilnikoviella flava]|uniref:Uncharacterized protein n=1 Tax=Krasilnikoviella flava TaxID=526729 RepID=A0A1T5JJX2_9MICO|nr:hypothetical protein [Krasilnikoviella flava]SKC51709.1 hypothetical protein SAMN04324258_1464 [Krasilnikoviella flava]